MDRIWLYLGLSAIFFPDCIGALNFWFEDAARLQEYLTVLELQANTKNTVDCRALLERPSV